MQAQHAAGGQRRVWSLSLAILLCAALLRFYHLDYKGLWGDEIAQVRRSSIELPRIIDEYRAPPRFFLQFVLIHLTRDIKADDFFARLPSAAASVLAVAAAFATARRLAGRRTALIAMLFMVVAPLQVWYAQDARMYAALTLYSLVALYFFLRLLEQPDAKAIIGLAVANTLGLYNHLFGFLPFFAQIFAALGLVAHGLLVRKAVEHSHDRRGVARFLPHWFIPFILAVAIVCVLALPLVPGTLPFVLRSGLRDPSVEWRDLAPFQLTPTFVINLLAAFGLGAGTDWRMYLSLGFAILGLAALARRKPRAAWIAFAWVAFPLAVLALAHPRHEVITRYLIFMQPMYLIVAVYGMIKAAEAVWQFARRQFQFASQPWAKRLVPYSIVSLGVVVGAVLVVPPLSALYQRAKINDWRAIIGYLYDHAEPGDLLFGEQDTWVLNAFRYYSPSDRIVFSNPVPRVETLDRALEDGRRIWYLSVGGSFDPVGEEWARTHLTSINPNEWQRTDLVYTVDDPFVFPQSEGWAYLYFKGDDLPSRIVYQDETGDAAKGMGYITVKPHDTLQAKLALTGGTPRRLTMTFRSRQPVPFDVSANGARVEDVNQAGGKWETREWSLTGETSGEVLVEVKNLSGDAPLWVHAVELDSE